MLKVGLLGAGRIGQVHAVNIAGHAQSSLAAVADVSADAAQKLAKTHAAKVCSVDEILNDSAINAVLIATSTDTHSDLIEAAARSGKAILCEKPVDLSLTRAQACLQAVQGTQAPVMIGFNRRFDPNFAGLRQALSQNDIGQAEVLSITSFDPAPPPIEYIKVSGGLFRDMMIHDFDMANFLMGDFPVSVRAVASSIVDPAIGAAGDVDTSVVTLSYADGRIAVIKNSRRAVYGYDQRVEILGSKGLLQAGNMLESTVVRSTVDGVVAAKPTYFFLERYMSAYAAEWDSFVRAVLDKTPMPVTLQDGIAALALAEAATQSFQTGHAIPVSL